jgi:hypothetical protein
MILALGLWHFLTDPALPHIIRASIIYGQRYTAR